MRKVIAIVGKFASGKTTCVEYIRKKYDIDIFEIGDYVRKAYNNEANYRGTLIEYADSYYQQGKIDRFVKEAILEAENTNRNIIFSGVKSLAELSCLQQSYPTLFLLKIVSSRSERKNRYNKGSKDKVSFDNRNAVEEVWIHDLWKRAPFDFIIINQSDLGCLFNKIDCVMSKIIGNEGG